MNKKTMFLLAALLVMSLLLSACTGPAAKEPAPEGKLKIVATTTMLSDLASIIGDGRVHVDGLMGPGIDPHLYQASAGDVTLMQKADVVLYNGLHLEGKMADLFEKLQGTRQKVISIEEGLDVSTLLEWESDSSIHDPHVWFDVSLWKLGAKTLAAGLTEADPEGKAVYEANLEAYLRELDDLDTYVHNRAKELPEEKRVLVTAHDAFQYFGKAYGFEVRGLQGISTDAEAGTSDVSELAKFIVEREIKAIFLESSVPPKTIQAVQAAVKARGFDVGIGGELYSDSIGDEKSGADTYIKTVKANIDIIVDALK
ncbi:MAG: zinc ABC transporter solute-binding protein [Clostridiales bacterium]|nr:zinc ABC transporter solute-binding protein [Clostridiales bacterium]